MVQPLSDAVQASLVGGGGGLLVVGIYLAVNFPNLKGLGLVLLTLGAAIYAIKEIPGAQIPGQTQGSPRTPSGMSVAVATTEQELITYLSQGYIYQLETVFNGQRKIYLTKSC